MDLNLARVRIDYTVANVLFGTEGVFQFPFVTSQLVCKVKRVRDFYSVCVCMYLFNYLFKKCNCVSLK